MNESESVNASALLSDRLESLESQLARLTDFLAAQDAARKSRRRRITIRTLLVIVAFFAGFFAWYSSVYRRSRIQAYAVDHLVSQGAFVMYEPRDSLAVGLLPGKPNEPPAAIARALGVDFFQTATNVSTFGASNTLEKKEIIPAIASLQNLKRLRLAKLVLSSADLAPLVELNQLESLDIKGTRMDNGTLPWLSGTRLRWLDASHTMLGDRLLNELSRCPELQYLNMERTTVSDAGLQHLYSAKSLRHLDLKRVPASLNAVKRLATALPNCRIEYQPLVFASNGRVANGQRIYVFGKTRPVDPRKSNRAVPPVNANAASFTSPYFNRSPYQSIDRSFRSPFAN